MRPPVTPNAVYSYRESSCQQQLVVLPEIRQVFSVLNGWTKLLPARVFADVVRLHTALQRVQATSASFETATRGCGPLAAFTLWEWTKGRRLPLSSGWRRLDLHRRKPRAGGRAAEQVKPPLGSDRDNLGGVGAP